MGKYFIKAVRHYWWRGYYNNMGLRYSNPFGGYYTDYITIHNGKLTKLGFVYPYVNKGYKMCLYCDDVITSSGCNFMRLGVVKSSKHYPTFNIDNDGMINEICIYIDSTIISDKCVTDGIVELYYYKLPSMLLSPNYNCGYDFHIRNKKGTAIPLVPMVKKNWC